MIRAFCAGAMALSIGGAAPLQCKHDPDPSLRTEDSAGDALWLLAEKFRGEHKDAAARDTLRYLVDRYPGNRHAAAARDELSKAKEGDGGT